MKNLICSMGSVFVLTAFALAIPLNGVVAQTWRDFKIVFQDKKDNGKLTAHYRTEKLRVGCRTTVRLTNMSKSNILDYYFEFRFKEKGRGHEGKHSDHAVGHSDEWTYSTCGIKSIEISELEEK